MVTPKYAGEVRLNKLIADIRQRLEREAPDLLSLFSIMSHEAQFARDWLRKDLACLPKGASILEVGGGIFLLSCQLVREGFSVTTVDPLGDGFSEFGKLREHVLAVARASGPMPKMVESPIEEYIADGIFDFAFSINVMEHLNNPKEALARVLKALKPGASYRFFCPNYLFPYEPHFNIPTFFSKQITEKLFWKKITKNKRMEDPTGVWRSLNWITALDVRQYAKEQGWQSLEFRSETLADILERAVSDPEFSKRRAVWMVSIIRQTIGWKIHRLAKWFPVLLHPVMDCRLSRGA